MGIYKYNSLTNYGSLYLKKKLRFSLIENRKKKQHKCSLKKEKGFVYSRSPS